MWYIKVISIILIFSINNFNFINPIENFEDNVKILDHRVIDNSNEYFLDEINSRSCGSYCPYGVRGLTENHAHGGSWLDIFKNSNGIESKSNLTLFNYKSDSCDVRLTNNGLSFHNMGYLQSKKIILPAGMNWDSVIINKTESTSCSIDLKILNGNNEQLIYGPITTNGEVSIRDKIDSNTYRVIKLNATFKSLGSVSSLLHFWGVSWNTSTAWCDSLFGDIKGTFYNLTSGNGEIWLNRSNNNWYKYSNNPILINGPSSSWDNNAVGRPTIIFNGTGYMMWYEGRPASSTNWQIGLATSSDGITWTKYSGNPVLKTGTGGAWDCDYIGSPSVFFDGNIFKMWYQGEKGSNYQIGYATSTDGINWQKYSNNPVLDLSPSVNWDDNFVCHPNVYFNGLSYLMWYSGKDLANRNYKIGNATSNDGINWTKYSKNPIIIGPSGGGLGVSGMFVMPEKFRYLGWYTINNGSGAKINHATSIDGVNWINYINNPVLQESSSGWDSYSVGHPEIIIKDKQYHMYYEGYNNPPLQIGLAKSKFKTRGVLTSKAITLPNSTYYNKLLINKTEPNGTYVNVSILDGATQQSITSFENVRESMIDLSSISSIGHPSVILKASFESTGYATPSLNDWSMNWTSITPPKIINITSPNIVNRTHSVCIGLNLTDREELEYDLNLQIDYKSPVDTSWQNEYLSIPDYETDHWECNFTPTADAELGFYEFRFICKDSSQCLDSLLKPQFIKVINNDPIIEDISTLPYDARVNRTDTMKILISAADIETPKNNLVIKAKYKSLHDSDWNQIYKENILFKTDLWEVDFTPEKNDYLGNYVFNITCNDTDTEVYDMINIRVLNNAPGKPDVAIFPPKPQTLDNLMVKVTNEDDIETHKNNLKFWYRWYKDNFYMPAFENVTTIPSSATVKDQTWRCVVFVYDGDDVGPPGSVETTILNSPPVLVERFDSYEMFEDSPVILKEKLTTIFSDADNDSLKFTSTGEINLHVEIIPDNGTIKLKPRKNWFGTETINFYANDTFSVAAKETVLITVKPTNDLPEITGVGSQSISDSSKDLEFIVKQDDWLNLTITVEDIDGDVERGMITYIPNITDRSDFYFNDHEKKLIFHPRNEDVGWHYINITVTDNNETPIEYVSQHFKIHVLNVNDPPIVNIVAPEHGNEFLKTDKISFTCTAEDIDLLVWHSNEKLTFRWYTNKTDPGELGFEQQLNNLTLPVGYYNITVEAEDASGLKAYDYVQIVLKELPGEDTNSKQTTSIYLWFGLIILIIIIIISIILFVLTRKKKRKKEAFGIKEDQVLQPIAAYTPPTGLPGSPAVTRTAQLPQTQVIPIRPMVSTGTTTQTTAQLPPVTPSTQIPIRVDTRAYEQRFGIDSELTPQQKIKLLEDRLVRGEISEETFLNLKDKLEFEAKLYESAPQLPPANKTITTTTKQGPISTPPVIPQPSSAQPQPPRSQQALSGAQQNMHNMQLQPQPQTKQ